MEYTTFQLSAVPALKRLVLAAFPEYRRRTVSASTFPEQGTQVNSFWDGGSRDQYMLLDEAGRKRTLPTSHPYFDVARHGNPAGENELVKIDARGNITLKALPAGCVLVRGGTFCGKPAQAHVYLPAEQEQSLITASTTTRIE